MVAITRNMVLQDQLFLLPFVDFTALGVLKIRIGASQIRTLYPRYSVVFKTKYFMSVERF